MSSAIAADLNAPPESLPPPEPPHPWSLGIEISPEFYAIDQSTSTPSTKPAGSLASTVVKGTLSYGFSDNWAIRGSLEDEIKINRSIPTGGTNFDDTYQYFAEATVGYKFKLDAFTLTPWAGLGYTWDATGINGNSADSINNDAGYYVFYLEGDWAFNENWTWNVFNLRYRNAFGYTWETPKVSSGITYHIDSQNLVYANVGYAWKKLSDRGGTTSGPNIGSLDGDKWDLAVGYKRAF